MEPIRAQVCVLGGGPAGAASARRLALLGHSVVVVEKTAFPRERVGESLPGSVLPLLDVLGIREAVETEGFLRPSLARVRWAEENSVREIPLPSGFHVNRARFDQILLHAASDAGARVLQPACVIHHSTDKNERHTVEVQTNGGAARIESDFLVDATGRSSSLAGRMTRTGQQTTALYAYWRNLSPIQHQTAIEACPSEWLWGAALPDNVVNATVFIDSSRLRTGIAEHASAERFYDSLIHSSEILSTWVPGTRATRVHVCDATPRRHEKPVQNRFVKVGDASFSIDPLAAQGVHVALGSALHAAVMIHTILKRPSDEGIAEQFYVDRQRRSIEFHAGAACSLYADAARKYPTPFWRARAGTVKESSAKDRTVRVDWNAGTLVQVHPSVRFQDVPVIEGEFIVRAQGIWAAGIRAPVVFLDDIPIVPLLRAISGTTQCSDIIRIWSRTIPPGEGIRILNYMLQRGILQVSSIATGGVPSD
jgi:flavin-dependent dehydrogenase